MNQLEAYMRRERLSGQRARFMAPTLATKSLAALVLATLSLATPAGWLAVTGVWAEESLPDLGARVDEHVARYLETGNFAGAILVAQEGQVTLTRAYGDSNLELGITNQPDTVFHLASASKPFTTAAILLLEQDGALTVDDPLSKFVPDFPRADRITLHHLMINSTGIPNLNAMEIYDELARAPQTPESLVAAFRAAPAEFAPGERYGYSNSNYNLLALVIERASGEGFGEFLDRRIFSVLGMNDTGHHGDAAMIIPRQAHGYSPAGLAALEPAPSLDWSVKTGNGSIYSTVGDLNRFAQAIATGELLSASSIRKMHTAHIASAGYGWFVRPRHGRPQVHINGRSPGFSSYLGIYPEEELVVIVLGNVYNSFADSIGEAVGGLVLGEDIPLPPFRNIPLTPEQAKRVVGRFQFDETYYAPNWTLEIEARDGYLFAGGDWLMPASDSGDTFVHRRYTSLLQFTELEQGRYQQIRSDDFVAERLDQR